MILLLSFEKIMLVHSFNFFWSIFISFFSLLPFLDCNVQKYRMSKPKLTFQRTKVKFPIIYKFYEINSKFWNANAFHILILSLWYLYSCNFFPKMFDIKLLNCISSLKWKIYWTWTWNWNYPSIACPSTWCKKQK